MSLSNSEIIIYQTEDGRTRIQCRFEAETLWLTQAQLADLFAVSVPNINLHLKAIYAEGELAEAATIKSYLIVRNEGGRRVSRPVLHYSLPAILETGMKTGMKIIGMIRERPDISITAIAAALGMARSSIIERIEKLKNQGRLRRVGPDKGGHWEIVDKKD